MARRRRKNLRYAVLAIVISLILWSIAHGSSSVERGYDVPLVFKDLPDTLVITDQSDEEINVRVLGSRVALRNVSPSKMEYVLDVSGAKAGRTLHEVDVLAGADRRALRATRPRDGADPAGSGGRARRGL
jgi:hypothetical protein